MFYCKIAKMLWRKNAFSFYFYLSSYYILLFFMLKIHKILLFYPKYTKICEWGGVNLHSYDDQKAIYLRYLIKLKLLYYR